MSTEVTIRFLTDHPQAMMIDWLDSLGLLAPDVWAPLGLQPETIRLEVTARWDMGLIDRLAEAMFVKTMAERRREHPDIVVELWNDLLPATRQDWLNAAKEIVDGRTVHPDDGNLR